MKHLNEYDMDQIRVIIEKNSEGRWWVKMPGFTSPEVINEIEQMVPLCLMTDATRAEAVLNSESGSYQIVGLNLNSAMKIKGLLNKALNNCLSQLDVLQSEAMIQSAAQGLALELLGSEHTLDDIELTPTCPDCNLVMRFTFLVTTNLRTREKGEKQTYPIPGAPCNFPADFCADYDAEVKAKFPAMVEVQLKELFHKVREKFDEETTKTRARLEAWRERLFGRSDAIGTHGSVSPRGR